MVEGERAVDATELATALGPLYPKLRRVAAVAAPLETDPDDLVQEAIVRMLSTGHWTQIGDHGAYLRRAVVNLAANERRRLGRQRAALARGSAGALEWPSYPSDVGDLDRLDPASRVLVYLVDVERATVSEAALVVGCSQIAARARLSRARRRLRGVLEREEASDG